MNQKPMALNVYVTTCNKNRHLVANFAKLFNKFWSAEQPVTIVCYLFPDLPLPSNFRILSFGDKDETKVRQLHRLVNEIDDEYFILMAEDFYLVDYAHNINWDQRKDEHQFDRFGLQSIHDGYTKTAGNTTSLILKNVYQLENTEQYLCSLEASIWRREFMKKYIGHHRIQEGLDRDIEIHMSNVARQDNPVVLVPEKRVINYEDALRSGQPRIKFEGSRMYILKQGGDGRDVWVNSGIDI